MKRREIRAQLYIDQLGLCYYCNQLTVFLISSWDTPLPPNAATIEHLINKMDTSNRPNTKLVLACYKCNQEKEREVIRNTPIELIKHRASHRYLSRKRSILHSIRHNYEFEI